MPSSEINFEIPEAERKITPHAYQDYGGQMLKDQVRNLNYRGFPATSANTDLSTETKNLYAQILPAFDRELLGILDSHETTPKERAEAIETAHEVLRKKIELEYQKKAADSLKAEHGQSLGKDAAASETAESNFHRMEIFSAKVDETERQYANLGNAQLLIKVVPIVGTRGAIKYEVFCTNAQDVLRPVTQKVEAVKTEISTLKQNPTKRFFESTGRYLRTLAGRRIERHRLEDDVHPPLEAEKDDQAGKIEKMKKDVSELMKWHEETVTPRLFGEKKEIAPNLAELLSQIREVIEEFKLPYQTPPELEAIQVQLKSLAETVAKKEIEFNMAMVHFSLSHPSFMGLDYDWRATLQRQAGTKMDLSQL